MSEDMGQPDRLEQLVSTLSGPVGIRPGLVERIGGRRRRQRTVRVVATTVALALIAVGIVLRPRRPSDNGVTFALDAPASRSVALVGDFTDWRTDRVRLVHEPSGEWQVTLKLPPGRYRFAYLVDNTEWRADTRAAPALDDFGRPTSIITVAAR